jgi:hypothetical protein
MEISAMNKVFAAILFSLTYVLATIALSLTCGGVALAGPPQPSNDPAAVNTIKQLEQDMGDAMVQDLLTDFESFHDKLVSFENGPVEVEVFGKVAVAHGSVSEKRLRAGKDVSGNFVWMDVLENRGGKWVVVRGAGARLE